MWFVRYLLTRKIILVGILIGILFALVGLQIQRRFLQRKAKTPVAVIDYYDRTYQLYGNQIQHTKSKLKKEYNNESDASYFDEIQQNNDGDGRTVDSYDPTDIKTVLMWLQPRWIKRKGLRPNEIFSKCAEKRCRLTYEWDTDYNISECVIMFVPLGINPTFPVPEKRPGQVWVFYSGESAKNSVKLRKWRNVFNWTLTMRRDSDIPRANREMFVHSNPLIRDDLINIVRNKTKSIAWLVSHCSTQSKRHIYCEILQKYIPVDIYGLCGPLKCPKHHEECKEMLNTTYKFYLSFENSHCRDYLTEKVFDMMSQIDIVPITRSTVDYKQFFPPGSYINTADFETIESLANYIKYLLSNETAYMQYYEARKYYTYSFKLNPWVFCDICYRLHHPEKYFRLYDDVFEWWTDRQKDVVCPDPTDMH